MRLHHGLIPLLLVSLFGGCVRLHGPEDISRSLSSAAGVDLRRELGVTVTRSGLWLAKKSLKWSDEDEISLRGLKRLEVGVYEVVGEEVDGREALRLDRLPESWTPWLRVAEGGEEVVVLVRRERAASEIRRMLIGRELFNATN